MAQLEGIRIQNYRSLKDVTLGRTFEDEARDPLPRLLAVIGANGSGKSSLIDALDFVGASLRYGVDEACGLRGGFERLRTQGQHGPLRIEICYRPSPEAQPISYSLHVDAGSDGHARVVFERLRQRRPGRATEPPSPFLEIAQGRGHVWSGISTTESEGSVRTEVRLESPERLGVAALGNLGEHPRIIALRQFLEGWYLSFFDPQLARVLPAAEAQKHLSRRGENLANYVRFLERHDKRRLRQVLEQIARKIPGVEKIQVKRSEDGRLLIQLNERGYQDPFYAQAMSDGTLKLFAYLVLLQDPDPAPLIAIEEPENGLHHQLLSSLAHEMKRCTQQENGPQIVLTTHSPYLIDALVPEEVWILEKDSLGFTTIERAADLPSVRELFDEGLPLGSLWYSNDFRRGNP